MVQTPSDTRTVGQYFIKELSVPMSELSQGQSVTFRCERSGGKEQQYTLKISETDSVELAHFFKGSREKLIDFSSLNIAENQRQHHELLDFLLLENSFNISTVFVVNTITKNPLRVAQYFNEMQDDKLEVVPLKVNRMKELLESCADADLSNAIQLFKSYSETNMSTAAAALLKLSERDLGKLLQTQLIEPDLFCNILACLDGEEQNKLVQLQFKNEYCSTPAQLTYRTKIINQAVCNNVEICKVLMANIPIESLSRIAKTDSWIQIDITTIAKVIAGLNEPRIFNCFNALQINPLNLIIKKTETNELSHDSWLAVNTFVNSPETVDIKNETQRYTFQNISNAEVSLQDYLPIFKYIQATTLKAILMGNKDGHSNESIEKALTYLLPLLEPTQQESLAVLLFESASLNMAADREQGTDFLSKLSPAQLVIIIPEDVLINSLYTRVNSKADFCFLLMFFSERVTMLVMNKAAFLNQQHLVAIASALVDCPEPAAKVLFSGLTDKIFVHIKAQSIEERKALVGCVAAFEHLSSMGHKIQEDKVRILSELYVSFFPDDKAKFIEKVILFVTTEQLQEIESNAQKLLEPLLVCKEPHQQQHGLSPFDEMPQTDIWATELSNRTNEHFTVDPALVRQLYLKPNQVVTPRSLVTIYSGRTHEIQQGSLLVGIPKRDMRLVKPELLTDEIQTAYQVCLGSSTLEDTKNQLAKFFIEVEIWRHKTQCVSPCQQERLRLGLAELIAHFQLLFIVGKNTPNSVMGSRVSGGKVLMFNQIRNLIQTRDKLTHDAQLWTNARTVDGNIRDIETVIKKILLGSGLTPFEQNLRKRATEQSVAKFCLEELLKKTMNLTLESTIPQQTEIANIQVKIKIKEDAFQIATESVEKEHIAEKIQVLTVTLNAYETQFSEISTKLNDMKCCEMREFFVLVTEISERLFNRWCLLKRQQQITLTPLQNNKDKYDMPSEIAKSSIEKTLKSTIATGLSKRMNKLAGANRDSTTRKLDFSVQAAYYEMLLQLKPASEVVLIVDNDISENSTLAHISAHLIDHTVLDIPYHHKKIIGKEAVRSNIFSINKSCKDEKSQLEEKLVKAIYFSQAPTEPNFLYCLVENSKETFFLIMNQRHLSFSHLSHSDLKFFRSIVITDVIAMHQLSYNIQKSIELMYPQQEQSETKEIALQKFNDTLSVARGDFSKDILIHLSKCGRHYFVQLLVETSYITVSHLTLFAFYQGCCSLLRSDFVNENTRDDKQLSSYTSQMQADILFVFEILPKWPSALNIIAMSLESENYKKWNEAKEKADLGASTSTQYGDPKMQLNIALNFVITCWTAIQLQMIEPALESETIKTKIGRLIFFANELKN